MTDYKQELQAFVDAAASFTEPALGHHKAWAEAVARARVALSVSESPASTVCPITPPPELVQQWRSKWMASNCDRDSYQNIATQAARWGADQELEACCEWLLVNSWKTLDSRLRAARRPKPPSLKEQALNELSRSCVHGYLKQEAADIILRALEALDD